MSEIDEIRKKIDGTDYWDKRIVSIRCGDFLDELELILEDNVMYTFKKCYKTEFCHDIGKIKRFDYSNMIGTESVYFMFSFDIEKINMNGYVFFESKLLAWPMTLNIISQEIMISALSGSYP